VKRESPAQRQKARLVWPLIGGFAASSVTVFMVFAFVGQSLRASAVWHVLLPASLVVCAVMDVVFPRIRCSIFRRQTPRDLMARTTPRIGAFLWGLDTGSVFSTFRASSGAWAALAVAAAGWAPPWIGFLYAIGFGGPLALLVCANSDRTLRFRSLSQFIRADARAVVQTLGSHAQLARNVSAALALAAAATSIASSL